MPLFGLLFCFGRGLLPLAVIATLYLYLYPVFHGCAFPPPRHAQDDKIAPFRLLALGDPQIEGDTSLPRPEDPVFPSFASFPQHVGSVGIGQAARKTAAALFQNDIPRLLWSYRKRLDLFGNDYYLAHIYRTLYWWTEPSHVTVLGDLLGSQWIGDKEFERRSWRFWHRVFLGGQRVEDHITSVQRTEGLGADPAWSRRIINVAGNHDIGYAGDINEDRITRFERQYGPVNWETTFRLNGSNASAAAEQPPEIRIVVLNSMNLDTPALVEDLQHETYDFINDVIGRSRPVEDRSTFTVLLTHVPLHKEAGVCVDAPFFSYFPTERGAGIKEQNHIGDSASQGILTGIFGLSGDPNAPGRGLGRNGMILTGHDHEGCDVYHHHPRDADGWKAARWQDSGNLTADADMPGVREVTMRSMMGEYGGYAGLVSVWFDQAVGEWRFDIMQCHLGVQHIWWAVHIVDLVTLLMLIGGIVGRALVKSKPTMLPDKAALKKE
ncbi:uncharacterized protein K452DRAFT_290877 [Aplosporella prunicola CBS 121167]|uniref:Calcineurin-like phosphoesterase domain-containing protein n=1 Tax=Aplosporella prunicola CBS 121167 TaxID=1176127 RepID=A0A6A6B2L1_9PEZI|nr:uncharacterized protein K452DRAFT_290877 [Aplosporella prunicola CBS 121167]KAF2138290.1 hypothetical protein K452DRAFT_290877 [Aplosporella prunicola CBS 121167]